MKKKLAKAKVRAKPCCALEAGPGIELDSHDASHIDCEVGQGIRQEASGRAVLRAVHRLPRAVEPHSHSSTCWSRCNSPRSTSPATRSCTHAGRSKPWPITSAGNRGTLAISRSTLGAAGRCNGGRSRRRSREPPRPMAGSVRYRRVHRIAVSAGRSLACYCSCSAYAWIVCRARATSASAAYEECEDACKCMYVLKKQLAEELAERAVAAKNAKDSKRKK